MAIRPTVIMLSGVLILLISVLHRRSVYLLKRSFTYLKDGGLIQTPVSSMKTSSITRVTCSVSGFRFIASGSGLPSRSFAIVLALHARESGGCPGSGAGGITEGLAED